MTYTYENEAARYFHTVRKLQHLRAYAPTYAEWERFPELDEALSVQLVVSDDGYVWFEILA